MVIPRTTAWRAALSALALGLVAFAPAACSRTQSSAPGASVGAPGEASPAVAGTPRVELGASVQLDSGNTAYRAKDYARALTHYRDAAAREPGLAAAWFGIYMAQTALGNATGADSAMKKVQQLAPGMGAHPTTGANGANGAMGATESSGTAAALPPGHPALPGAPKR